MCSLHNYVFQLEPHKMFRKSKPFSENGWPLRRLVVSLSRVVDFPLRIACFIFKSIALHLKILGSLTRSLSSHVIQSFFSHCEIIGFLKEIIVQFPEVSFFLYKCIIILENQWDRWSPVEVICFRLNIIDFPCWMILLGRARSGYRKRDGPQKSLTKRNYGEESKISMRPSVERPPNIVRSSYRYRLALAGPLEPCQAWQGSVAHLSG